MSTTGKSWKIARYDGVTPYNIDGIPSAPIITKHVDQEQELGTGQRRMLNLDATNIYWTVNMRMKLLRLDQFIKPYAFVTAEGDLPSFNLYTTDGTTAQGHTGVYVDRCEINVGQRGSAIATLNMICNAYETKTLTVTPDALIPITKAGFTASVGGTSITKWTNIRFAVDNSVARVPTGTGAVVSEVYPRQPVYTGRIEFVKTGAPLFGYDAVVKRDVIIAVTDNQATPVTKTFTFTNAAVNEDAYQVENLDLTYEILTWTGDKLTLP